ncbi:hypothetical protein ACTXIZ_11875 [Psychrobacter celer]|uniref:hypothetical protein n=1 Tax=Psychrobacter celer TaxID=306572 RepID=UPI003FD177B2
MGDPYAGEHVDDEDRKELSDEEQQKENDELQEMGKQGLTDDDFPDGRPSNTFR